MAKNLIICFVLWIVVAVIAEHTAVAENNTTTAPPSNTTASMTTVAPNATAPPSNTTASMTTAASNATAPPSNTTASMTTAASNATAPPSNTTASMTTAASNATAPPSNTTASMTTAASNTTAPPSNTTASMTTAASNTTAPPSNTTAPGTTAPPTPTPGPCSNNPCGLGSTCEARANQTFICLCLSGDYYSNVTKRCETAKVFPGLLELPQIVYENDMSDKASPAFKRAADIITEELDKSLRSDPTYRGCIVLELVPVSNTRLRATQHVNASVELIYSAESNVTTSQVQEMVKTATNCTNCQLKGATFAEVDLCQRNPCDVVTTSCSLKDGILSCTCQPDYVPSNHSTRNCLACPSGKKAENSECVPCSFGHSGFNCNENWLFILVIVGSVLGGLLLIALILLIIVSVRSPKKSSKRQMPDIGSPYMSHSPAKGPLGNGSSVHGQAASVNGSAASSAAFANAGLPRFPRATANNSYDNRGNLEMIHGNSRQNLIPTDMNSQLDDNQYDTNPYAQGRGQNNPYARSQGQTNHYYN